MTLKIMLVDDEVSFINILAKRLRKRGLEIQSATSGQEALSRLAEEEIDVVILDVMMPEMDGVETLRRIKASFPLIEVIMLSGHGTVISAIEGLKLGALDYLIKPCGIEVLLAKAYEAQEIKKKREDRIKEANSRKS